MGLGNTTPAAEFNIYVDPEAAREVFESGLPITMSGLDVTHQAGAGRRARPFAGNGGLGEVVAGLLDFFAGTYGGSSASTPLPCTTPSPSPPSWNRACLRTRAMRVDVECESDLTRGETVCDFHGVTGKRANAEVGLGLDREAFFDLLHDSLRRL